MSTLAKLVEASGLRLQIEVIAGLGVVRGLPDTPLGRRLRRHRRAVVEAAARRGGTNVRVFGSVARGEDTEGSDIDLLIDIGVGVGLVGLIGLEHELEEILGRKVDVVPATSLKPAVEERALAEAIPL
jgi:predicted nucleotidyltransferase